MISELNYLNISEIKGPSKLVPGLIEWITTGLMVKAEIGCLNGSFGT